MGESRARLAFIGCGSFATSRIFPQIPLVPEIDLVAVCDVVREKAERNAPPGRCGTSPTDAWGRSKGALTSGTATTPFGLAKPCTEARTVKGSSS